ncbi:RHS repeat-associated core domain-containing protein [Kitasatospora sp. NPDC098663]|uniref:RHS repeat-associated core domain-containing protein n=1 Tax=Kitasatospora sp. NPDC098663 TaxID=3364096 RepID=UPI00380660B7
MLRQSTRPYPGADRVDTTPPTGRAPTTELTNALGQTISSVVHGGSGTGDATTAYGYDRGGTVLIQAADPHGTNGVKIGTDAAMTVTRRPTYPFGNPRGTQPATGQWAGTKGYVGGAKGDATGLTNLGAREYDPSAGRFINPDPILDRADPQQWNGYAYSDNNPVNLSDPSGMRPDGTCGGSGLCRTPDGHTVEEGWSLQSGGWSVEVRKSELAYLPGNIGFPVIPDYQKVLKKTVDQLAEYQKEHYRFGVSAVEDETQYRAAALNACQEVAACDDTSVYNKLWDDRMSWELENFPAFGPAEGAGSGGSILAGGNSAKGGVRGGSSSQGSRVRGCDSFPVQTLVLMADGSTKPIGDLQPGDVVTATDPQTGETGGTAITHKTVTPDDSRFTDLTLAKADENGTPGPETELTSTAHHPYWDDTTHRWTAAEDLRPGDQLTTPDHRRLVVVSARTYSTEPQTADNLTVADRHTYYVLAGRTPVLVHNDGGTPDVARLPDLSGLSQADADSVVARNGFELQAISEKYATYVGGDKTKLTIRLEDGRVTRTSMVDPGSNQKNYPQRWDQNGEKTQSHDHGEYLGCK